MLLSLLDKEAFPMDSINQRVILSAFHNAFNQDPNCVRRVLADRMIRRTVGDYFGAKFPDLESRVVDVALEGVHKDVYMAVYENDSLLAGHKLFELVKTSIDPNLVNPDLLPENLRRQSGRMESSVYSNLDLIIENSVDSGGKVLIFSDLKRGVTDKLAKRYSEFGALVINGDTSAKTQNKDISLREELRRKFQNDDKHKVLITTQVMDEGVDLTAASDVVHLTMPYTPAALDQRNRRAQRMGQYSRDKVNVHMIKPKIGTLLHTVTEGIFRLLDEKRRIISYIVESPFRITKGDLDEIKNGCNYKSRNIAPLIRNPANVLSKHFGQLKGKGFSKLKEHYRKFPQEAEYIARLYASHWENYYGGNTAKVYEKVINTLRRHQTLDDIIDVGSGPFSLSRILGEPVTNVDLNPHMFEAGRVLEEEGVVPKGNISLEGYFHNIPVDDESFDLAVASLGLHMTKLKVGSGKKTFHEREQAFREFNRVLRPEGYGIVTLPHSVILDRDTQTFSEGLKQLGFEYLPFSGFYQGIDQNGKNSNFKVFLAAMKKVNEPQKEKVDETLLEWKMDRREKKSSRTSVNRRKGAPREEKIVKPEPITGAYLIGQRERSLDELIGEVA